MIGEREADPVYRQWKTLRAIGLGAGDPELLTSRGPVLQAAQVVVFRTVGTARQCQETIADRWMSETCEELQLLDR